MILKSIHNISLFSEKAEPVLGVFASQKWMSIYGNSLSVIGIYKDEQQLIGGFYFFKTKKASLPFIKLPPYTPHCCLFWLSDSKNKASQNNVTKEVMTEVCDYISKQHAALTILAFPWQIKDLQPFIWNNFKVIPHYTYHLALNQSIEEIRANYDSKNRNAINKSLKEGVEVRLNHVPNNTLYDYFVSSLQTTDANIYHHELHQLFTVFADTTNSFSMNAYLADKNIGNVFCAYDANTCYYLLGGVDKNAGVQGINNLLVDKCIENAQLLGCQTFDFEGSMLKGVEKFFRSFGPELVPYYTVNKASLPLELLLKFKKRALF